VAEQSGRFFFLVQGERSEYFVLTDYCTCKDYVQNVARAGVSSRRMCKHVAAVHWAEKRKKLKTVELPEAEFAMAFCIKHAESLQ